MQAIAQFSPNDRRQSDGAGSREQIDAQMPEASPAAISQLTDCMIKTGDRTLTREEFASIFNVSTRTVTRWKDRFNLPTVTKNSRVIRYTLESVLMICAQGVVLHTGNALKHGLIPERVLAIAAQRRAHAQAVSRREADAGASASKSALIAVDEDVRQLMAVWRDERKGQLLRAIVRMMATAPDPWGGLKTESKFST